MTPRLRRLPLLLAALLGMAGTPLAADTFKVMLGGRALGQIDLSSSAGQQRLRATLNNTPFGVFDGSFTANSSETRTPHVYTGMSRSSRKSRDITVISKDRKVIETRVVPEDERTALSDPARVPAGVLDPVEAFARFATASDCPAGFRFYDGRRVIAVAPTSRTEAGADLTCSYAYRVEAGPGHLSPLYIKSFALEILYASDPASREIASFSVKTGPFSLRLER